MNFLRNMFLLIDKDSNKLDKSENDSNAAKYENILVSHILETNKENIHKIFDKFPDLIIREIKIANNSHISAMFIYLNNMAERHLIEEVIIKKLIAKCEDSDYYPGSKEYSQYLLGVRKQDIYENMSGVIDNVLSGNLILFVDGLDEAMVINVNNPPSRAIQEPEVETVVRGPREGFTESLTTNIALIRKKIKSPNLKVEFFKIGKETRTDVSILYLSNIVNYKVVDELRERLNRIDIDAVMAANYIKEYIEDEPLSSFPIVYSTERPDVVANKVLEGRVAIIVDGTPLVVTCPCIFMEFLTTNEDYNLKFVPATINRWVRYVALIITLILPGLYLAITTFHQELVPTELLITLIRSRVSVPYPEIFECLLMLGVYEILREAGVRMPRVVGQAISVIGALVLGQAAVEAGIVSTPMVIIISCTAISSFAIPSTDMYTALVLPRFILILLGGFLGLLGLTCGLIILFMHLISIRSFGVPYIAPFAPVVSDEVIDMLVRRPIWSKVKRSWLITRKHSNRRNPKSRIKSVKEEQKKAMKQKENKE